MKHQQFKYVILLRCMSQLLALNGLDRAADEVCFCG
jgi:hypothetical protein